MPKFPSFAPVLISMALLAGTATMPASAQPDPGDFSTLSVEQLKAAYLACERITSARRVSAEEMQWCVIIGDALRDRHFGGDFERMLAWWRAERARAEVAAAAPRS